MIHLYERSSSLRDNPDDTTASLFAQFIRAATQPSAPALLGTVGITAFLFALCVVLITPDFMMNGGARYVAAGPTDDYAFVSAEAMRMRQAGPQPLAVALFGASALREAVSGDEHLKALLSAGLGRPTAVYNLTTSRQSYWETAALTDALGRRFTGAVVLNIVPLLLADTTETLADLVRHPRLAFTSSALDEEVRLAGLTVPARTGNYFLDNRQFFLARLGRASLHILTGPVARATGRYVDRKPMSDAALQEVLRGIKARMATYHESVERHLAVIARLIARWRALGATEIVLLESPANRWRADSALDGELGQAYRSRIERFVRDHGVHHWSLDVAAALVEHDFYDSAHLASRDAQRRFTSALATSLTRILAPQVTREQSR